MTDAEITHRTEQAMLGAMMARPRSAGQLNVDTSYFADPRHQAIAAVLTGTAGTERSLLGRIRAFFARRSRTARDAAAYMDELPGLCPDPGHIATYFQMLTADRDQRAAQTQARVEAQGSQVLDVAADRLGQLRGRPDHLTGLPSGTARLARALRFHRDQQPRTPEPAPAPVQAQRPGPAPAPGQQPRQAQPQATGVQPGAIPRQAQAPAPAQASPVFQPFQNQGPSSAYTRGPSGPTAPSAAQTQPMPSREARQTGAPEQAPAAAQTGDTAASGAGSRGNGALGSPAGLGGFARSEDLQDAVLSALLNHPDEAREVVGWLDPEAFTGPRRELYTLICQHAADGRDIDPVTVAWHASQRTENRTGGQPRTEHDGWLRPDDVLRTGSLDAAPGTATVLGKMLYADHVCAVNFGRADWHRAPQTAPAQARPQHEPGSGPVPNQTPEQRPDRKPGHQQEHPSPEQKPERQQAPKEQERTPAPQRQPAAANGQTTRRSAPPQPGPDQPGPYRQGPPPNGTRPPTRRTERPVPGGQVPGTLIQPPPPVPGQDGPSPVQ